MSTTTQRDLRAAFLDYFKGRGHTVVKSAPLLPQNDPTLMFTNAGMVQFKDVFVGAEKRPYSRATTCQKCMRVSGKHNDLEEVGRTTRHHTFFEMLGNFSFGDYFKEEAIAYAWEFSTREVGLDPKRLWVTVFEGAPGIPADDEARALWKKISGLPDERILALGMKDNFWAMGDSGPCGPCTEIHYDTGSGTVRPEDFANGRVIEFWNNVFMQFNRHGDGRLEPLPKPSVDTGMGLERLTTLIEGKDSNYHASLFTPLLDAIARIVGKPYTKSPSEDDVSMRVLADHARATAFLVADGLQPSNEGRGYVMRRIMRRAIRHGAKLGMERVFFPEVCDVVVETMRHAYPELDEARRVIAKIVDLEERGFRRTLGTGLKLLGDELDAALATPAKTLPGASAFKLYDTYGFPMDLTQLIAAERGVTVDEAGFEREMSAQQERSRGAELGVSGIAPIYKEAVAKLGETEFAGYPHEDEPLANRKGKWREQRDGGRTWLELKTRIVALIQQGKLVESATGQVEVVLSPTPFYGESGGQAGDRGVLRTAEGAALSVATNTKPVEGLTVARVDAGKTTLSVGAQVWAGYDVEVRKATRAHHSATHLLHGALRRVLGEHVKQAGSLVDAEHLRFDYSHFEPPTRAELARVEAEANAAIRANAPVNTDVLPFDEAKQKGAIALFGEKYGDVVRVVSMGPSVEFCGGTHAKHTGELGLVLITREEAVASGVRRLEAQVGAAARQTIEQTAARLATVADILSGRTPPEAAKDEPILLAVAKAKRTEVELAIALGEKPSHAALTFARLEAGGTPTADEGRRLLDVWQGFVQLANARGAQAEAVADQLASQDREGLLRAMVGVQQRVRELERRAEDSRRAELTGQLGDLAAQARVVGRVKLVTKRVDGLDAKSMRELADQVKHKLGSGVVCLATVVDEKVSLLVTVTADHQTALKAGDLVRVLAPLVDGRGGGKPDMAQAGGTKPSGIDEAFAKLAELVAAA